MDNQKVGTIFADVKLKIAKGEEANVIKQAVTIARKVTSKMNDEMQKGFTRGIASGIGSIFGGSAGAMVGAMGGGLAGVAGIAIGSLIEAMIRKIGTEVSSKISGSKFLESIHMPIIQPDINAIKSVKGYLMNISGTEALRIAEISKALGSSPEALAKQVAISRDYAGFKELEGGSDVEKILNFLTNTSGLDVKNRVKEGAKYGITPLNIPALKTGFGDINLTKLGRLSGVDFQNYGSLLESVMEEERSAKEQLLELELNTIRGLSTSKKQLLGTTSLGEGFYKSLYSSPVGQAKRDIYSGLDQMTVYQNQKDSLDDASYITNKAVKIFLSEGWTEIVQNVKMIAQVAKKVSDRDVILGQKDSIRTGKKLNPMSGITRNINRDDGRDYG